MLEVREVSKRYGSLTVTDGVSLAVDPGEVVGILGPNGAGKTTLFNIISGDVAPDAGSVHFAGQDVTKLRRTSAAGAGSADPIRSRNPSEA